MSGLDQKSAPVELELVSAASLLPEVWSHELDDHVLDLRWSAGGEYVAALPSVGRILIFDGRGKICAELPGHGGGNCSVSWHPKHPTLATYGQDASVRIYEAPFNQSKIHSLEKGWAERAVWNADGTLLGASLGKSLFILEAGSGLVRQVFGDHRSTICDIAWNPKNPLEITSVCDGGAYLWRVGEKKLFGQFDWGGASVMVSWSPDGRWIVTGDQTPSVHLYEVKRKQALHIQGFATKVKALAWQGSGEWLATGGGPTITVWPCSGKKGPRGATPIQLTGHSGDARALDFLPRKPILVSGGRDGLLLLWSPHRKLEPAIISRRREAITTVRWSPDELTLAAGTASGEVIFFQTNQPKRGT